MNHCQNLGTCDEYIHNVQYFVIKIYEISTQNTFSNHKITPEDNILLTIMM